MENLKELAEREIVEKFHKLYYNSLVWDRNTTWMGVRTEKCPLDLWIYQEIIFRTKPDVIIETGTLEGGTTLFLAHQLDILKRGWVVTVDCVKSQNRPKHDRIIYLEGDSVSDEVLKEVDGIIFSNEKVMVILDSEHSCTHVLEEIIKYSKFVTIGNYLIVEDTNLNGNPVVKDHGPGPMEAVQEFLKTNKDFEVDSDCEKFFMTFNLGGLSQKN